MKDNSNQEEYFYRFESVLIPIIPTFMIIIAAILFNKYSSKSKRNNKKLINNKTDINKKEKDNNKQNIENNKEKKSGDKKTSGKRGLLGGNPRDKPDNNNLENKQKINKKQKNDKEILEKLIKSPFFMDFFKGINKYKGFSGMEIEKLFHEELIRQKMEKYFLMGDYNSLKKFNIIEKIDDNNKDNILVYYSDDNKNEKENIFNRNDFINDFETIIINYDSKEINLLFPKEKNIKKFSDNELLEVIKNSWCINNIYSIFKLNADHKIGLSLNSIENKYNVYLINNYITTTNEIKIENNKEKDNSDIRDKNYIINNVKASNVINITNMNIQKDINDIQNNIDKNEIKDNSNNNIIINENANKNNINQEKSQNQNQNQNQNQINNNYNTNNNFNQNNNNNGCVNMVYIFPLVGLNNVGSTCFMNATLHITKIFNIIIFILICMDHFLQENSKKL